MAPTWLKKRREAKRMTQEALATALGHSDSTAVKRLEGCKPEALQRPPYEELAKALDASVIELADDHARDLRASGQHERAELARKIAAGAWREDRFSQVDVGILERALTACTGTRLVAEMARRPAQAPDAAAQARHIAELLTRDRLDDLFNLTRIPLREAIAAARDGQQLDALHGFLIAVACQCAAADPQLAPGEWHPLPKDALAWPIRAMIDRSRDLKGMHLVQPMAEAFGSKLDDGPDSTRAMRSGHAAHAAVDARLRELVFGIGDLLPTVKCPRPAPGHDQGFADYCKVVNGELLVHNDDHSHVFGVWDPATMEAGEVKQRLLELLPNLRLFTCEADLGERPLLRVDHARLEAWLASHLRLIQERRRALVGNRADQPTPTTPPEPQPMSNPKTSPAAPSMHFDKCNINMTTGPQSQATQANDQAAVNQINATDTNRQLLDGLAQLLANTDPRNVAHKPLRSAVRELQTELEETGDVSPPAVRRFEHAKEGLSITEQAFSIAANVASLLAMAGLGG
jgi:hypothetical protein